jgi:hypothetical protein
MMSRPKLVEGPRRIHETAVAAIAAHLEKSTAKTPAALASVVAPVIEEGISRFRADAEKQIDKIMADAARKALEGWKGREKSLVQDVVRIMVRTRTEERMEIWAQAVAAQVAAEVDDRNLIDTGILESLEFDTPRLKGDPAGTTHKRNAYTATDEEFLAWWATQIGDRGIDTTNRLAVRLLLVACLDWIQDERRHWREPRLGELEVYKKREPAEVAV